MRDGVAETLPLMWVSCGAFDELLARLHVRCIQCDSEGDQHGIFNQPEKSKALWNKTRSLSVCTVNRVGNVYCMGSVRFFFYLFT